jgi:hypothetical protein
MTDKPIAWGMPRPDGAIIDCITPEEHARMPGQYTVPLYAAPQPRRRLTDQEIEDVFFDMGQFAKVDLKAFARAIEAAVWGEKT